MGTPRSLQRTQTDDYAHEAHTRAVNSRNVRSSPHRRGVAVMRVAALFSLITACMLCAPVAAQAATWPLSASARCVSCGFHSIYTANGQSYTHCGADIPASAGASISAPLAGTVSYVGSVPSGDARVGSSSASDATMKAVSVKLASGRTVTLMPFASVSVSKGQAVAEGETLGTLAATGDVSSEGTHLHMGLKQDGTYYDPLTLFGMTSQDASEASASESAAAAASYASAGSAAATEAAEASSSAQAATSADEAVSAASDALEADVQSSDELSLADESVQVGTISSGDVAYLPQAQHGTSIAQRVGYALQPLMQACVSQLHALHSTLVAFSDATGIPYVLSACALAAAALALLVLAAYMLVLRAIPAARAAFRKNIAPLLAKCSLVAVKGG